MSDDYQILELLPGDRALISTAGRFRVEFINSDEIAAELLTAEEADAMIEGFTRCFRRPEPRKQKVSYAEVAREATA